MSCFSIIDTTRKTLTQNSRKMTNNNKLQIIYFINALKFMKDKSIK